MENQVRSNAMQCHWKSWEVVSYGHLKLELPKNNYPDMKGVIKTAMILYPDVKKISTFVGGRGGYGLLP